MTKQNLNAAKILSITGLGNLSELYNFTLFAVLMPILVAKFFPNNSYETSIIIGYTAFAASFMIAPLGSIFWGYIGDKFSSSRIFKFSLLIMALPSLGISALPTYEEAGALAPILLIILRMLQSFSASGEILSSKIYAFDSLGQKNYLLASGIISSFGAIGVLLSMYFGGYISASSNQNLWRLPFLIGGISTILILLFRIALYRSQDIPATQKNIVTLSSVFKVIVENPKVSLKTFMVSALLGVLSYFMHGFIVSFQFSHLGYDLNFSYYNTKLGLFSTCIFSVLSGIYFKSIASFRKTILLTSIIFPLLYLLLLLKDPLIASVAIFCMGGLLGIFATLGGVYVIDSFSIEKRCRGALLVNAFGIAIFGGLTPLAMTFASNVNLILPGALLMIFIATTYKVLD
ncbi:MAG: hypothetical protein K0R73_1434 [Candidatus Midichloriaceae bacterium]|jgi:MHS family proline/betaine transporter-like MFS transporter|nr:hypothetical protein [Candidatus Midichloriaceae bacterium]